MVVLFAVAVKVNNNVVVAPTATLVGLTVILPLPSPAESVKSVVATPETSPVTTTWYVATNQLGRLN